MSVKDRKCQNLLKEKSICILFTRYMFKTLRGKKHEVKEWKYMPVEYQPKTGGIHEQIKIRQIALLRIKIVNT